MRDCAHKHKAICSYAGACPALVTALDDVKRASDERLSYYVGRALTLLLQTRRAARLTWLKEKEAESTSSSPLSTVSVVTSRRLSSAPSVMVKRLEDRAEAGEGAW